MTPATPSEFARWLAAIVDHAREIGGGRSSCCAHEQCALHLAEDHPAGGKASTVHLGSGLAVFPESRGQELTAGGAKAAFMLGLRVLGIGQEDLG